MAPTERLEWVYDGRCPICVQLKQDLEARDTSHTIEFTDFTAPEFDFREHGGVDTDELRTDVHVLRWRGTTPEVFKGLAALSLLETVVPSQESADDVFDSVLASFEEEGCDEEECHDVWNNLSEQAKLVKESYDEDD